MLAARTACRASTITIRGSTGRDWENVGNGVWHQGSGHGDEIMTLSGDASYLRYIGIGARPPALGVVVRLPLYGWVLPWGNTDVGGLCTSRRVRHVSPKLPDDRRRAFPTAEGFRAAAHGGRGGQTHRTRLSPFPAIAVFVIAGPLLAAVRSASRAVRSVQPPNRYEIQKSNQSYFLSKLSRARSLFGRD